MATAEIQERDVAGAAEFVEFFAEGWAIGATDPERFYAHYEPRVAPDARFIQPIARAGDGPRALREIFAPLFAAVPDLRGEVLRWGATADGVMIELELRGTFSGRPLSWITVDRIVLRDGMIAERRANLDPLPILATMLRRPVAAIRLLPRLLKKERS